MSSNKEQTLKSTPTFFSLVGNHVSCQDMSDLHIYGFEYQRFGKVIWYQQNVGTHIAGVPRTYVVRILAYLQHA
jgi:hypothetical protein